MTLRDLMNRHARTVLTRIDHFGETVTYVFKAGGSRQVRAVVNRLDVQPAGPGVSQIGRQTATVFIARHATDGVMSHTKGDKLELALELGGDEVEARIVRVIDEDEGGFLLEVAG